MTLAVVMLYAAFVAAAYTVNESSMHPARGIDTDLVTGACIAVIVACMFFVSWVIVR